MSTEESPAVQTVTRSLDEFRRTLDQLTPRAWVTPALVAINLAVFVAFSLTDHSLMEPSTEGLLRWGANYAPKTTNGQWWRLLTCTFMHIGLIHVAMNMAVLFDMGRTVEKMTGNLAFFVSYLLAGLGGSIASLAWNPKTFSAGASGAVFGVYGVLLGFLLRGKKSVPPEVLQHLTKGAIFFVGYNVFYGLKTTGIDNAAHLGGLATGFACGLLLAHPLTADGSRKRGKKALVLLAGGLVLLAGAASAIPRQVDFDALELRLIHRWSDVAGQFDEKKLSGPAAADVVEKELLPPWREQRQRFQADASGYKPKFLDYLRLRQEYWELIAKALRSDDEEAFQRARAKNQELEKILDELNKTQ